VLHRVTYVSRIPPRSKPTRVEAIPADVRRPANVEANMGLIREIERIKLLLVPGPGETQLVTLGRAIDRLLFGDGSGDGQSQGELVQTASWWRDLDKERVKEPIRLDLMAYLRAYYESDLGAAAAQQRVIEGLQVLYTFEEGKGNTVNDVSGVGQPMNLTIGRDGGAVHWLPGGLEMGGETRVGTTSAATKIIQAAKACDEVSIEVWLKPLDTAQHSGCIMALSSTSAPGQRNFRLGQHGKHYQACLRTKTQRVGATLDAGETASDNLTHLVYTRAVSGAATFYLNGVAVASDGIPGDFSNWNVGHHFSLGSEANGAQPWQGDLYLVAVYNRALGPAEVAQNYHAGAGSVLAPAPRATTKQAPRERGLILPR
jgi:hypothetical protein